MKIAAIEAMWHTEAAPASFTIVGFPDCAPRETTNYAVRVPWVLGLIATRSIDVQGGGYQRTGRSVGLLRGFAAACSRIKPCSSGTAHDSDGRSHR